MQIRSHLWSFQAAEAVSRAALRHQDLPSGCKTYRPSLVGFQYGGVLDHQITEAGSPDLPTAAALVIRLEGGRMFVRGQGQERSMRPKKKTVSEY